MSRNSSLLDLINEVNKSINKIPSDNISNPVSITRNSGYESLGDKTDEQIQTSRSLKTNVYQHRKHITHCPNCGAPIEGEICEYCKSKINYWIED